MLARSALGTETRDHVDDQVVLAAGDNLFGNLLKGLQLRRPALFILNAPCPREWGIAQDSAPEAARLALESRAVPNIVFDPDRGKTWSESLNLEGNPSPEDRWTSRELTYVDEEGEEQRMTLPLTIADWALGEERFRAHFRAPQEGARLVPFHEYLDLDQDERADAAPFIYTVDAERQLGKICVSQEVVDLAEERLRYWAQLKELAGIEVSDHMREAVGETESRKLEQQLAALKGEYEAKITQLTAQYPVLIARKIADNFQNVQAKEPVLLLQDISGLEMDINVPEQDFALATPGITGQAAQRLLDRVIHDLPRAIICRQGYSLFGPGPLDGQ